jgi:RNAse (barnase) inhibitor barstar
MAGAIVSIAGGAIKDWPSFHDVFAEAFGFPSFYGRNMDAWIDCLSDLDLASGMTTVHVRSGEILTVLLEDAAELRQRCPEQFEALIACSAFVNFRRVEAGDPPILAVAMVGHFVPGTSALGKPDQT